MTEPQSASPRDGRAPLENSAYGLYPLSLTDLAGALVVVVGGGRVAERKLLTLPAAGAAIRLVSPAGTPALLRLAESGAIDWLQRPYASGDLAGARLAIAATNERAVNARVASDAAAAGILCNVADRPEEGNVHLPAVLRVDGLVIAVSTEAGDPTRAKDVRDAIGAWLASASGNRSP